MDHYLPQNPPKFDATKKVNAWSIEKMLSCSWRWEEQRHGREIYVRSFLFLVRPTKKSVI